MGHVFIKRYISIGDSTNQACSGNLYSRTHSLKMTNDNIPEECKCIFCGVAIHSFDSNGKCINSNCELGEN